MSVFLMLFHVVFMILFAVFGDYSDSAHAKNFANSNGTEHVNVDVYYPSKYPFLSKVFILTFIDSNSLLFAQCSRMFTS